MRSVPNPVHKPQRCSIKRVFRKVVLDDDPGTRDAGRFAEEALDLMGMVQYINKRHYIPAIVIVGDRAAVEHPNRDVSIFPDQDIDTFDSKVGTVALPQRGDSPIASSDIKNAPALGKERLDLAG